MKSKLSLSAIAIAAIVAGSAGGQQCQPSVTQTMSAAYQENRIWPVPYVMAPRYSICNTFNAMRDSGWRRQNMLGQYHFNADGTELSQAGRTKVQWIATQAMPNRRQIYVQQSDSAEATSERVASVQRFVATGYPNGGEHVVVNETPMQFEGRPAASVDTTMVGYQANQPAPVLPSSTGSSSSSSSSSGSGQ